MGRKILQIEPTRWGNSAVCWVTVCEHLDQSWSIRYESHVVARYNAKGWLGLSERNLDCPGKTVEKTMRGKAQRLAFPLQLEAVVLRGIPMVVKRKRGFQ